MATVRLLRSTTPGNTPSSLVPGQIAINESDGKLFYRNSAGAVTLLSDPRWALFLPAASTGLTATPGNAQATVSWTAPTGVLAQAPVTDYVVQVSSNSGSTWTTFSDGSSTATSATVTGLTNGTAYVFRVAAVNGVGTGAFTAASSSVTPTAGDPLFASVALLLPMNGTGSTFTDASATPKTITASGNATQSATQSKFGGKSLYLDGSGDYLTIPSSADFGFGTGDFTVEYWWYPTQNSGDEVLLDFRTGNAPMPLLIGKSSAGAVRCYDGGAVRTGGTMNLNEWSHVAWSRSGSDNSIYLNGTRVINFTNAFDAGSSRGLTIGANVNVGFENAQGYVDEIRITKGSDRGYTGATITVPTAAFLAPISAPTSLTATGGNAQVSLAWTAPSYNGGSAITDYSVQFSSDSGSTWSTVSRTASTTASQVVTGLTNGTAYVFRVAGVNANGTGTYTAASSSVTPNASAVVTGGTVSTPGDGYTYRTFTSSGTLEISGASLTADVLVVGGGGSGGRNFGGGGGGGGGVLYQTNQSIATGSYAVTVAPTAGLNSSGTASSIGALYSATGGAAGGSAGAFGGSAGGSSGLPTSASNSTANSGGSGVTAEDADSGGQGGGAGGAGVNGQNGSRVNSSNGRSAFSSVYGVGGRGGRNGDATAYNGNNNTGNGGSGGSDAFSNNGCGTGGSGIVVIRYLA